MNGEFSPQWRRLSEIIDKAGLTINSFAKHIGLNNTERLYRIQKGKNDISRSLAEIIHNAYPKYSVSWIMCGTDYGAGSSEVLEIPMYGSARSLLAGKPERKLIISESAAGNAQCALQYSNGSPNAPKYLRDIILLLRRVAIPQLLRSDEMCFIVTKYYNGVCIVQDFDDCLSVRYKCIMKRRSENRITPFSDISGAWIVCGMVSRSNH